MSPFTHRERMNMTEGNSVTNGYSTTDLNLAAFLLARGLPLLKTDGGSRKTFHFSVEARDLAPEFYQNVLVPVRTFANALRDLKTRLREVNW